MPVALWDTILTNPMINGLIVLEQLLFGNFGLAIIVFTVVVRLATLPLTLRQLHAGRKMQALTPQVQEIQKKYKEPKKRQEETMKLYREQGANPLGCIGPMVIQLPIWFTLYRVLTMTVGGTPERTAELAHRLYPWDFIQSAVPLPTTFLWLNLGRQDTTFILFGLTFVTTWLQTKLSMSQPGVQQTPSQQQTNTMMLWMMPAMFAYFTLSVPSGLALYWVVNNISGIVMNWFVYGWHRRPLREVFVSANAAPAPAARPARPGRNGATGGGEPAAIETPTKRPELDDARSKRTADGKRRDKRKNGGGGGREGPRSTGSGPVSGRRRNRQ